MAVSFSYINIWKNILFVTVKKHSSMIRLCPEYAVSVI